ncbi:MAG: hypothetical protein ACK5MG_06855 [Bacteroidales bacterium]
MTNLSTFIVANNMQEEMNSPNNKHDTIREQNPTNQTINNIIAFASVYEYYKSDICELEFFLN